MKTNLTDEQFVQLFKKQTELKRVRVKDITEAYNNIIVSAQSPSGKDQLELRMELSNDLQDEVARAITNHFKRCRGVNARKSDAYTVTTELINFMSSIVTELSESAVNEVDIAEAMRAHLVKEGVI